MSMDELERKLKRTALKMGAGQTIRKTIRGPNRAVPRNPRAPISGFRGTQRGFGKKTLADRLAKRRRIG